MYGLITRLTAHPGRRDELGLCLLDPNLRRPGCHSYVLALIATWGDTVFTRPIGGVGL
jgi:quinol monooxygenase YgiN